MIETIRWGLKGEGFTISIAKRCKWFKIPRRMVDCRSTKAAPKSDPKFVEPIGPCLKSRRPLV